MLQLWLKVTRLIFAYLKLRGVKLSRNRWNAKMDDETIQDINKAIKDIDKIYFYYSHILKRQKNLSALSKVAKRRMDLNKAIQYTSNRATDIQKDLQLLKHKVYNLKKTNTKAIISEHTKYSKYTKSVRGH